MKSRILSVFLPEEIAEGVGGTPAQVRKDLAYFGEFGTRGVGYNVKQLNQEIMNILGLTKRWNVILIGAGNLGSALSQYRGFRERGFRIIGVFDNDLNKVGLKLNGLPIYAVSQMAEFIGKNDVTIGIIAVPAEYAQDIADILVETDIKGILNFAPVVLTIPEEVEVLQRRFDRKPGSINPTILKNDNNKKRKALLT